MKKILVGMGIVAVIIVAIGVYVLENLGPIIAASIEKYGSQVAGVPVRVGGVDIDPKKGTAVIHDLSLGNPPGFTSAHALRADRISVTLDTQSLTSNLVTISDILVFAPQITYEMGDSGSNFDVIKAHVMKDHGSGSGAVPAPDDTQSRADKKIIIDTIAIRTGTIGVTAAFLDGRTLNLDLPDVRLTGIGRDTAGASPTKVSRKILQALGRAVTKAVAKPVEGLTQTLEQTAGDALDTLKKGIGDSDTGRAVMEGLFGDDSQTER